MIEPSRRTFTHHYQTVMNEAMNCSRIVRDKTEKVKNINGFGHPAMQDLKELLDKYYNFTRHAHYFFTKTLEVVFSKQNNDDVDDMIALSLAASEAEVAEEEMHVMQHVEVKGKITPQEMQKRAFAAYKKLLCIHRDISESLQLADITISARMKSAYIVSLYIAIENYAASNGKNIIPAENMFPAYKDSILDFKRLRMAKVLEVEFVTQLSESLRAASNIIQSMNSVFTEENVANSAWIDKIKIQSQAPTLEKA